MSETHSHAAETREPRTAAYVRTQEAPKLPPPASQVGVWGWLWRNVFSSMANFSSIGAGVQSALMIVLTLGIGWFFVVSIWQLFDFAVLSAIWSDPTGARGAACRTVNQVDGLLPAGTDPGACWPYAAAYWKQIIYGRYPDSELWRVNIVYLIGAIGIAWLMIERAPLRKWVAVFMLAVFPVMTFILLTGGNLDVGPGFWVFWGLLAAACLGAGYAADQGIGGDALGAFGGILKAVGYLSVYLLVIVFVATIDFGMETVETANWGGLLVTLVVAITGIVASLPLGILLALGRRSTLPLVRILSVIFIEFWRGVPLITVLFMSSVMLPLFLPEGTDFNKLLRALIGVALFSSAYMAEVVRGGLQAIPKGQYEGAMALGLPFWRMMRLIILPQALTLVIPGIVNTFIGLFKDTTLVLIIGLFDLLGQINNSFADNEWSSPVQANTGYLVAGAIFWVFCFGMSRYSMYMERKLRRGHSR